MEIRHETQETQTVGGLREEKFEVRQDPMLFLVLSNMYSNPLLAGCRENITNMWDAYVAASLESDKSALDLAIERPPRIHLPTNDEPWIEFQDFGIGMDLETVYSVWKVFLESDKRGSNDQAGGFGLGVKANYAYTDHWTMTTRKDGKEWIFACQKDEDGYPSIVQMSESDTEELNGVTIRVPIHYRDNYSVKGYVYDLLKYVPMPVLVDNKLYEEKPNYIISGQGWGLRTNDGEGPKAILGPVAYPIDSSEVGLSDYKYNKICVDLFIPIGSVNLPPDREGLLYSQRTKDFLRPLLTQVMDEKIPAAVKKLVLDGKKTRWEQLVAIHELQQARTYGAALRNVSVDPFRFDDVEHLQTELKVDKLTVTMYHNLGRWGKKVATCRASRFSPGETITISPDTIDEVIVDDIPKARNRIKVKVEAAYDKHRILCISGDRKDIKKWVKRLRKLLDGVPLTMLSDLPKVTPVTRGGGGTRSIAALHQLTQHGSWYRNPNRPVSVNEHTYYVPFYKGQPEFTKFEMEHTHEETGQTITFRVRDLLYRIEKLKNKGKLPKEVQVLGYPRTRKKEREALAIPHVDVLLEQVIKLLVEDFAEHLTALRKLSRFNTISTEPGYNVLITGAGQWEVLEEEDLGVSQRAIDFVRAIVDEYTVAKDTHADRLSSVSRYVDDEELVQDTPFVWEEVIDEALENNPLLTTAAKMYSHMYGDRKWNARPVLQRALLVAIDELLPEVEEDQLVA